MKSPSLPEGLVDDVFSPVARLSYGARRERPECDIPKSVGALHQSANALILTTDLFHATASARPKPKHRSQDKGPSAALVPLKPVQLLWERRWDGGGAEERPVTSMVFPNRLRDG